MTAPHVTHIRASDLYDLALCPHRIALDRALPRDARTPPDRVTRLLLDAGIALEARIAAALGYPQPRYTFGDFAAGARATFDLMREGVGGIYQGVLLDERFLAIPDLLERRDGPSALGDWHYVPGDVKAGLTPRADQVLQVAFAGFLLERAQGLAPTEGFLVLGDERRETFSLDDISHVAASARRRVVSIVDGAETTLPFLDDACTRCRWRGTCIPDLLARRDLSLIEGMTRARQRVLLAHGISTVDHLANRGDSRLAGTVDLEGQSTYGDSRLRGTGTSVPAASPAAPSAPAASAAPLPNLGLATLAAQARALASDTIDAGRGFEIPPCAAGFHVIHIERDPLAEGALGFAAWAHFDRLSPAAAGAAAVVADAAIATALDEAQRAALAETLIDALGPGATPIFHFGGRPARALDVLCELARVPPARQAALDQRLCDLRVVLRRGAAFLPVRRTELDDVAAAVTGRAAPSPGEGPEPAFVALAGLRSGVDGPWLEELSALGRTRVEQLAAVLAFLAAHPAPPSRSRRP